MSIGLLVLIVVIVTVCVYICGFILLFIGIGIFALIQNLIFRKRVMRKLRDVDLEHFD